MKKTMLTMAVLLSTSAFAYDPQFSLEVAVCHGKLGNELKEITVFRDTNDKSKASILYKTAQKESVAMDTKLFTGASAARVENTLEAKHEKINITIDLASEKADKTMSGKWENQVDLICRIVTPIID